MSYDHTFDDYIRDIPLVRSSRYFVPSAVSHVAIRPPPIPYECEYSFEAEFAARRAHETYTRGKEEFATAAAAAAAAPPAPPPHRASPIEGRTNLPSTSYPLLQPVRGAPLPPVLQPSRTSDVAGAASLPSVSSSSSLASSSTAVQHENFEEFEGGKTIFDELHMKSIDDRRALNEIWGAVQVLPNSTVSFNAAAAAAAAPPPVPAARTVVPLAAAATAAPAVPPRLSPTGAAAACAAATQKPALPPKPVTPPANRRPGVPNGTTTAVSPPNLSDSRAALAAKLTAKGFRSHVVQLALGTLPQNQLQYVEYYIKATSNLEKVKVPADKGMAFLIGCNLTEKSSILPHSDTVVQLLGMGFPLEKCMQAAKETKGDRVKALDICLNQ